MQIFGAQGKSTAFMAWAGNDSFTYYSGRKIYGPIYDKYLRVNVVHETKSRKVTFDVGGNSYGLPSATAASAHLAGAATRARSRIDVCQQLGQARQRAGRQRSAGFVLQRRVGSPALTRPADYEYRT